MSDLHHIHPLAGKRVYIRRLYPEPVRVSDWWPRLVGDYLGRVDPWDPTRITLTEEEEYVARYRYSPFLLDTPVAVRSGRLMDSTVLVHDTEILGVIDGADDRRFWPIRFCDICGGILRGRHCAVCGAPVERGRK